MRGTFSLSSKLRTRSRPSGNLCKLVSRWADGTSFGRTTTLTTRSRLCTRPSLPTTSVVSPLWSSAHKSATVLVFPFVSPQVEVSRLHPLSHTSSSSAVAHGLLPFICEMLSRGTSRSVPVAW